jgi:hypothetical protein
MKLKNILTIIPGSQIVSIIVTGETLLDKYEAINVNSKLFSTELEYPIIRIETEKEVLKIYCWKI